MQNPKISTGVGLGMTALVWKEWENVIGYEPHEPYARTHDGWIGDIRSRLPFRNDSFHLEFARLRIQAGPVRFQMVEIQQPRLPLANQFPQSPLATKKRQRKSSPFSHSRSKA